MAEREHLDLLELVRAEDAARVLARRAGLAPEARRDAAVAQREILLGQDLAHVQRGQRDLGGADQEQLGIGVRDRVDLLARLREEAAADQRLLAHEHRGHDRREALADELVERVLHRRDVQPDEVAEQVGEARARGARAALDVDHAAGEVEVVARLAVELRLRAARHRRAAARPPRACRRRRVACGRFGSCEHRRLEGRVDLAQLLLERRQAVAQLGGRCHLGGRVAPGALGLADRLRRGVALARAARRPGSGARAGARPARAPRRAGRRPRGGRAPRARARYRSGSGGCRACASQPSLVRPRAPRAAARRRRRAPMGSRRRPRP